VGRAWGGKIVAGRGLAPVPDPEPAAGQVCILCAWRG
jgi:hypothetical protein